MLRSLVGSEMCIRDSLLWWITYVSVSETNQLASRLAAYIIFFGDPRPCYPDAVMAMTALRWQTTPVVRPVIASLVPSRRIAGPIARTRRNCEVTTHFYWRKSSSWPIYESEPLHYLMGETGRSATNRDSSRAILAEAAFARDLAASDPPPPLLSLRPGVLEGVTSWR